ncbi:MAG TPA: hypothetical protein V6D06_14285, partial [Trichocoleus sp.]
GVVASKAIEGIGVTATALGERQVRYDLFVALNRGERPGPLPSAQEAEPAAEPEAPTAPAPPATPAPAPSPEASPPAQ